jgi:hypothetical protein
MTGVSVVRMISHVGVRLMVRHGGGGHSTDGLQDKSRSLWPVRPAADGRKIKGLARCSLLHDSLHFGNTRATSGTIAHRALVAP